MLCKKLFFASVVLFVLLSFPLINSVGASSEMWSQTYGGKGSEIAYSLVETSDGGYALAGVTDSFGAGGNDFWLIKTDSFGNVEWNQTYGGTDSSIAYSLVETSDGGFALAGETYSFDEGNGFWLVKTDANGNLEWNQTYRRTNYDRPYSLIQTSDGGFALAGETINLGSIYLWVVKTNENGIIPEFPSWAILPLFLTATLVVAIYRRKLSKTSNPAFILGD